MENVNCPCKRKSCERYGKCAECRAHHAKTRRKRPCEREKTRLEAQREEEKTDGV